MSFILATLQSCTVAVCKQKPSDVFVYEENSPICLCVMYINVALYGIYIKPEECWYIKKIRAWFLQSFLVVRCPLLFYMPVNEDVLAEKLSGETKPSDLWDQPVLLLLHSVWRVLKLVWSLRCPLLLGVGSAWRRRTGDALVNSKQYYLLPLLLKVLLWWMTLFSTLESIGCRTENEYIINVGSHLANAVQLIVCVCVVFFFFLFCFLI